MIPWHRPPQVYLEWDEAEGRSRSVRFPFKIAHGVHRMPFGTKASNMNDIFSPPISISPWGPRQVSQRPYPIKLTCLQLLASVFNILTPLKAIKILQMGRSSPPCLGPAAAYSPFFILLSSIPLFDHLPPPGDPHSDFFSV